MSPDELERLGQALHGHRWKSALARDLDMSYRQILRYAQGEPIPKVVAIAVKALARG